MSFNIFGHCSQRNIGIHSVPMPPHLDELLHLLSEYIKADHNMGEDNHKNQDFNNDEFKILFTQTVTALALNENLAAAGEEENEGVDHVNIDTTTHLQIQIHLEVVDDVYYS